MLQRCVRPWAKIDRAVRYIGAISVGPRALKVCDIYMFKRAVIYLNDKALEPLTSLVQASHYHFSE